MLLCLNLIKKIMKISKLTINNFKNFIKLDNIEFNSVNLIVGANASGKTTFFQIFELLKNIKRIGLQEAVSQMDSINSLINFNSTKRSFELKFEISLMEEIDKEKIPNTNKYTVRIRDKILFLIEFYLKGEDDFQIKERITFIEYFAEFKEDNEKEKLTDNIEYGVENKLGQFKTFPSRLNITGIKKISTGKEFVPYIENPFHRTFIEELNRNYREKSLLEYPGMFASQELFDFGIYDFNPQKAKERNNIKGTKKLEKDGANLTRVIYNILKDEEKKEQFIAAVTGILDFVEDIKVLKGGGRLDLIVKEKHNNKYTDSKLLSDGTISIIALIVALYYQEHDIIFIEEPEHGIHPSLINRVTKKFYIVAEYYNKQIFVTTHSPVLLKNMYYKTRSLKDIYTLQRDRKTNNSSIINKPNIDTFKDFLEEFSEEALDFFIEEIGIDNLFIQNTLK